MATLEEKKRCLKTQINQAFDGLAYPGDDNLCSSSNERIEVEPDLQRFVSAFCGQHWKNIKPEVIKSHATELAFFTSEALQFFIPAFLVTALDNYESDHPLFSFTIYSLNPADSEGRIIDDLCRKLDRFTPEQAASIRAFLIFARDDIPDTSTTDSAAEALANYWLRR